MKAFTSHIKQYLHHALTDHQLTLLKKNRKLTFYSSFKNDTKKATFLDMIKNPQHRIHVAITKLRLGNHHLHIETGRHSIPKTPENLRLCSFCNTNKIENEIHFLSFCKHYDRWRIKLFNEITEKYAHCKELDAQSKILFLFNSIDPTVCRKTAAFAHDCMNYRQQLLFQTSLRGWRNFRSYTKTLPRARPNPTSYRGRLIVQFTVVCFGTWPLSGTEAGGDLVLIQTSSFSYVNGN